MRVPSPAASTMVRLDRADIRIPVLAASGGRCCAAALIEGFRSGMETRFGTGERHGNRSEFKAKTLFPVNVCAVIRAGLGRADNFVWPRILDHLAGSFETENTGGVLTGFLAEEDEFDRRALWRLGSWGVASVGAVVLAVLANQSSIGWRRDQVAAADLSRQAQQIQSVARESQNEARRLASAIETLNSDRDRLYSRVTVAGTGAGFGDRRHCPANRHRNPAASRFPPGRRPRRQRCRQARPVVAPVATTAAAAPEKPHAAARGGRARASHGCIDRTGTTKSAGEPGHAADGGAIDDGAARCRGRQTDRTGGAGEDRHVAAPIPEVVCGDRRRSRMSPRRSPRNSRSANRIRRRCRRRQFGRRPARAVAGPAEVEIECAAVGVAADHRGEGRQQRARHAAAAGRRTAAATRRRPRRSAPR